ncbi:MAG: hypothetical protein COA73_08160 [Candidatus Hydrogenedentota bacterium]|nr:MAG: hypothetical protein COA73_08160 [Candidatus Hydrogenedentota bacterium]
MKSVFSSIVLILSITSMALFLAGPLLAYFRILPSQAGFGLFAIGCLLGLLTGLIGVVMLMRSGPMPGGVIAILGGLPALFLIYSLVGARGKPMINDVATDTAMPPLFSHAQTLSENADRNFDFPKGNAELIKDAYGDLEPLGLNQSVDDVFGSLTDYIRSQDGWELTYSKVGDSESIIEGTSSSGLFRFVDDFVVRITGVDSGGCVVDIRSKSRDGKGDFGVNAERIRTIIRHLKG